LFTSEGYLQGSEKQAVCIVMVAFSHGKQAAYESNEDFDSAGLHVERAD
jgi:hypothetical protein